MQEGGTIQWFPGHMARTRRKIKESLGLVDATVEIIDARIPVSSRNPELDGLVGEKPRLIVLNKADLADEVATRAWSLSSGQRAPPPWGRTANPAGAWSDFPPCSRSCWRTSWPPGKAKEWEAARSG